jgi:hypothetical protein
LSRRVGVDGVWRTVWVRERGGKGRVSRERDRESGRWQRTSSSSSSSSHSPSSPRRRRVLIASPVGVVPSCRRGYVLAYGVGEGERRGETGKRETESEGGVNAPRHHRRCCQRASPSSLSSSPHRLVFTPSLSPPCRFGVDGIWQGRG